MKVRAARPPVPPEQVETVRREITALIAETPHSAREISGKVHIPEKEVYAHLEHLRRSAHHGGYRLETEPSRCNRCGFVFAKRDRLTPPGKCPVCRHESIADPLFSLVWK